MTTPLTEEDTRAEEARILTIIAIQGITPPGISINTPSLASDSDDSHVSISSSDSSDHVVSPVKVYTKSCNRAKHLHFALKENYQQMISLFHSEIMPFWQRASTYRVLYRKDQ